MFSLALVGFSSPAWPEKTDFAKAAKRLSYYPTLRKPVLQNGPLRYENITDNEVREIRQRLDDQSLGDIVSISGVVAACGCEEVAACTDQVAIDLVKAGQPRRVIMSHVNGKWDLGRLQAWWLRLEDYEAICRRSTALTRSGLDAACERQRQGLVESAPRCPVK